MQDLSISPTPLAEFLADVLPTVAADPGPSECWAWKAMRVNHSGLAGLSAAIEVVERHAQTAALKRRVKNEHPCRKAHLDQYDERLRDCLTEACAFAWADLRGLGDPQFDYRKGMPDVHVPPDLWVEAKAVQDSAASRVVTKSMLAGECHLGVPAPPDQDRSLALAEKWLDARKKFGRLGRGRWVVFFNLTTVDNDQLVNQEEVLTKYTKGLARVETAYPSVSIVLCHAYDWQHPIRDPFMI